MLLLVHRIDRILIQKENKGGNSETVFSDHNVVKLNIDNYTPMQKKKNLTIKFRTFKQFLGQEEIKPHTSKYFKKRDDENPKY